MLFIVCTIHRHRKHSRAEGAIEKRGHRKRMVLSALEFCARKGARSLSADWYVCTSVDGASLANLRPVSLASI